MKIVYLISAILLVIVGLLNGEFFTCPSYVQDAREELSSKISYSYGETQCNEKHQAEEWFITCKPDDSKEIFTFIAYPAKKSPYMISTSFYLRAANDAARIIAKKDPNENLLAYLLIDTE